MPVRDPSGESRPARSDPRPRPRSRRPADAPLVAESRGRRGRDASPAAVRDAWIVPLIAVIAIVIGSALVIAWTRSSTGATASVRNGSAPGAVSQRAVEEVSPEDEPEAPTPVFAKLGPLRIHLPVPAASVTAIAFHQASFNNAMGLTPLVPIMTLQTALRIASHKRAVKAGTATTTLEPTDTAAPAPAATATPDPDLWGGKAIQLWRSGRGGKPVTAVDCGASPGTSVYAPVDGTVSYVRRYKLYGKYDDYEVHISPRDLPSVDCVVIHITDVAVSAGQEVEAGVTKLAKVRLLSKYTGLQLRDYTDNGGDHCHVQINRTPKAGFLWISTPAGPQMVPFQGSTPATSAVTSPTP